MTLYNKKSNSKEPVYLNVYDLHPINNYFYPIGLGAFHSGVEIHGIEYSYGGHEFSFSGVFEITPRSAHGVTFRQAILLGETSKTPNQIQTIVDQISEEFSGISYHPLQKNCNYFSEQFVKRVLDVSIPAYINRLAHIGNFFSCFIPTSLGLTTPSAQRQLDANKPTNQNGEDGDINTPLFPGSGYSLQPISNGDNNNNGQSSSFSPLLLTSSSESLNSNTSHDSLNGSPSLNSINNNNNSSSIIPNENESLDEMQERRNRMLSAATKRLTQSPLSTSVSSTSITSTSALLLSEPKIDDDYDDNNQN